MIQLRDYQQRAVDNVFREWEEKRSTLVVHPTGTGKTSTFIEIIRRMFEKGKRAIICAHREELIHQARERAELQADLGCEVEMADEVASTSLFHRSPVVVATIQTLISGNGDKRRLNRFDPNDFGLLVIDEAHHSTAASYRRVIDHFLQNPELVVLGVTATPDRADEEALGQLFDTVADVYEILDAINDGWLVPIDQQMVNVDSLDFSNIRTTAGDLNGADLAAVMEAESNLHGVVGPSIEIIGDKRTIVFTSSVRHAEMACEIFNRHRQGMADWVCGKTDKESRRRIMRDFKSGAVQVLCNVGVVTEGVDVPAAEVVIMARPTKSRALYAQMAGRILRPLPGLVDSEADAESRKTAIAQSTKPSALIVDFAGNSGRHKLMTSADILGGNVTDEAIELAKREARKGGRKRVDELLLEAQREVDEARKRAEAARRAKLIGQARYTTQKVDPFAAFDIAPPRSRGWDAGKQLSEKQRTFLRKHLMVDPDEIPYASAKRLIDEQFRRWHNNLCSVKQASLLRRFGYDTKEMRRERASELITRLKENKWKHPELAA